MAMMKEKSVPGGMNGKSMLYPQAKGFTPSFWGAGWNGSNVANPSFATGSSKGMLAANAKRKMSCPNCG